MNNYQPIMGQGYQQPMVPSMSQQGVQPMGNSYQLQASVIPSQHQQQFDPMYQQQAAQMQIQQMNMMQYPGYVAMQPAMYDANGAVMSYPAVQMVPAVGNQSIIAQQNANQVIDQSQFLGNASQGIQGNQHHAQVAPNQFQLQTQMPGSQQGMTQNIQQQPHQSYPQPSTQTNYPQQGAPAINLNSNSSSSDMQEKMQGSQSQADDKELTKLRTELTELDGKIKQYETDYKKWYQEFLQWQKQHESHPDQTQFVEYQKQYQATIEQQQQQLQTQRKELLSQISEKEPKKINPPMESQAMKQPNLQSENLAQRQMHRHGNEMSGGLSSHQIVNQNVNANNRQQNQNVNQHVPTDYRQQNQNVNQNVPTDYRHQNQNVNQNVSTEYRQHNQNVNQNIPTDYRQQNQNVNQSVPTDYGQQNQNVNQNATTDYRQQSEHFQKGHNLSSANNQHNEANQFQQNHFNKPNDETSNDWKQHQRQSRAGAMHSNEHQFHQQQPNSTFGSEQGSQQLQNYPSNEQSSRQKHERPTDAVRFDTNRGDHVMEQKHHLSFQQSQESDPALPGPSNPQDQILRNVQGVRPMQGKHDQHPFPDKSVQEEPVVKRLNFSASEKRELEKNSPWIQEVPYAIRKPTQGPHRFDNPDAFMGADSRRPRPRNPHGGTRFPRPRHPGPSFERPSFEEHSAPRPRFGIRPGTPRQRFPGQLHERMPFRGRGAPGHPEFQRFDNPHKPHLSREQQRFDNLCEPHLHGELQQFGRSSFRHPAPPQESRPGMLRNADRQQPRFQSPVKRKIEETADKPDGRPPAPHERRPSPGANQIVDHRPPHSQGNNQARRGFDEGFKKEEIPQAPHELEEKTVQTKRDFDRGRFSNFVADVKPPFGQGTKPINRQTEFETKPLSTLPPLKHRAGIAANPDRGPDVAQKGDSKKRLVTPDKPVAGPVKRPTNDKPNEEPPHRFTSKPTPDEIRAAGQPCRYFPNCRYGAICFYVHPPCPAGKSCPNTMCILSHAKPSQSSVPVRPQPDPKESDNNEKPQSSASSLKSDTTSSQQDGDSATKTEDEKPTDEVAPVVDDVDYSKDLSVLDEGINFVASSSDKDNQIPSLPNVSHDNKEKSTPSESENVAKSRKAPSVERKHPQDAFSQLPRELIDRVPALRHNSNSDRPFPPRHRNPVVKNVPRPTSHVRLTRGANETDEEFDKRYQVWNRLNFPEEYDDMYETRKRELLAGRERVEYGRGGPPVRRRPYHNDAYIDDYERPYDRDVYMDDDREYYDDYASHRMPHVDRRLIDPAYPPPRPIEREWPPRPTSETVTIDYSHGRAQAPLVGIPTEEDVYGYGEALAESRTDKDIERHRFGDRRGREERDRERGHSSRYRSDESYEEYHLDGPHKNVETFDYSRRGRDRSRSPIGDRHSRLDLLSPEAELSRLKPEKKIEVVAIKDLLDKPGRENRPKQIVIILRGAPGCGKTHIAKLIKDKEVSHGANAPRILALDDYFLQETEVEEKDATTGKKKKTKKMEYIYEEEMEDVYRASLFKSFKKTLEDGFFPMIIVDSINNKLKHFEQVWSDAKHKGFEVYVAALQGDASECADKNIHNRSQADIEKLLKNWDPTPTHFKRLDVRSLLQDAAIDEVEMEEVEPVVEMKEEEIDGEDKEDDDGMAHFHIPKSKWEDNKEESLAKLDGICSRRKKTGTKSSALVPDDDIDDDDDPYDDKAEDMRIGKKRVRWADLEERKQVEHRKKIGFCIGTDWSVLTDPHAQVPE